MEIDKLLGRLRDRVWREFLNWTWEQRIVGLCLSAALSLFVGTMQDMSPGVMSLFVLVSTACVLATISWIRKSSVHVAAIEPVQQRIRALAGMIPGVDLVTRAVETSGATLLQGPRDWKKETVAGLRGMVRIRLVGEYGMCLAGDQPNEPARQFLLALSASLTADDLRKRDSHESVPNDQRSKEAGLTTTGPTEFSEMATLVPLTRGRLNYTILPPSSHRRTTPISPNFGRLPPKSAAICRRSPGVGVSNVGAIWQENCKVRN